ncbi:MAG: ATP-dependent 6-phosphofructokinase [Chloroflexi bacterium]|nr:ATP-dependent 6-phosphofructokinase [Chloroflexota bacterium]
MRLGVLTGGGDVPGLNACIKALVYRAEDEGHQVIGIRRGWKGLLNYNPDDKQTHARYILPLDKKVVRIIDRSGGTFLHTSRTNPAKVHPKHVPDFLIDPSHPPTTQLDCTDHVLRVIAHLGIDVLVPIGGDDTLGYGAHLHSQGVPIVSIPKTMDNDVFGTDYCIGFSTAVTRSVNLITDLRTPTGSHERIAIVELFGRNSGETSLVAAYLSGVDRAVISEVPFDIEKLSDLLLKDKRENPSNYAMLTISEGSRMVEGAVIESGNADAYGHRKLGGIGEITAQEIKKRTGEHIIYQRLAYLMRSGSPDSLDRMVATSFGNLAMNLITEGRTGQMVALQGGQYTSVPADTVSQGVKRVDVAELYDVDAYRPKVTHVFGKPMFLY